MLALLGPAAAAQTPPFPRTVTDALDRLVVIAQRPERIVAIFASNTEILAAIGAGPRIVGIESYTRYPPELLDRPKIGGRLGFSVEAMARLDTDLVVMTPARQAANQLVRPLDAVGIAAVVVDHRDVESVLANIALLGRVTGEEEGAARVIAGMRQRIASVQQRLAGSRPLRVYMETGSNDRGGFHSVREGTYTADILRLAGGSSVFASLAITQVSGEAVYNADPDVILIAGSAAQAAGVAQRAGWASMRAVAEGRVYAVPRVLTLIPGPRIVDGIDHLARLLHPQAFPVAGRAP